MSGAQVLDEDAETPAVGDGVMNGKDKQVVVRAATEHIHAVERALHKIEGLAEGLLHQFFDRFRLPLGGGSKSRNCILGVPLARIICMGALCRARRKGA